MFYISRFFTRRLLVAMLALLAVIVMGRDVAPDYSAANPVLSSAFSRANILQLLDVPHALQASSIAFGPNVRANQDDTAFGQHEPSLAVSRVNTNTVFVAAKDYREADIKQVWIYGSTDAGVTWPIQVEMPGIPPLVDKESDPVVMARDDGRIYVAVMAYGGDPFTGGIFITWTDDNGATWKDPSVAVSYPDRTLDDKEWFVIDNNPCSPYYHRMYMGYNRGPVTVMQHSTDGGETWSAHLPIGISSYNQFPSPVIGSDGTVYTFMWFPGVNFGPGTIELRKSTDGGVTWSVSSIVTSIQAPDSPIREGDSFRFISMPYAALDPNNGHLYVAWTDKRNFATNGTDVVYVKSTDGGNTWSPQPLRLSHDPTGVVRDHIIPVLSIGRDSRIHALWMDRRLDPANRLFDTWYSASTDGGATWEPDIRISEVSQDLNVGFPPESGNAAGDYWGLDTYLDTVYVAWNDTRTGNQDILVSKGLINTGGAKPPSGCPPTPVPPTATPIQVATPSAVPSVPTVEIPGSGSLTFPETGKTVPGLFLDYWQNNGGLAQQGYPISNVMGEVSPLDDKPYTVQYFERAVFEYHPENQPPYNVLLSQLGTFRYKQKYPNGAPGQTPNTSPGSVLFPETGKRVGGKFLEYWQTHGALAQQGYPISEEFTETSDLDGKTYTVQYFERAVFEMHPENQPPYDILLSQLGMFRYRDNYLPPSAPPVITPTP